MQFQIIQSNHSCRQGHTCELTLLHQFLPGMDCLIVIQCSPCSPLKAIFPSSATTVSSTATGLARNSCPPQCPVIGIAYCQAPFGYIPVCDLPPGGSWWSFASPFPRLVPCLESDLMFRTTQDVSEPSKSGCFTVFGHSFIERCFYGRMPFLTPTLLLSQTGLGTSMAVFLFVIQC